MKISKLPNFGDYGHIIDGVDFEHMTVEEWQDIGRLHLQGLVTVIRNVNLNKEDFRTWLTHFGDIRFTAEQRLKKKYGVSTVDELLLLYKAKRLEEYDMYQLKTKLHTLEKTKNGPIGRVTGTKDAKGNYQGVFGIGDVEWHSNEGSLLTFVPGVALLGHSHMVGSSTGFSHTANFYQDCSESLRSELDEMVIVYNFEKGALNHLEDEDEDFYKRLKEHFCPEEDMRVPFVVTSPGGIRGLHYPKYNMNRIEGMSIEESRRIFKLIEAYTLSPKNVYDHWYQNDNDLLLFDNSITMHRRIGGHPERLAYRMQFIYNKLVDNWCPYDKQPWIDMFWEQDSDIQTV